MTYSLLRFNTKDAMTSQDVETSSSRSILADKPPVFTLSDCLVSGSRGTPTHFHHVKPVMAQAWVRQLFSRRRLDGQQRGPSIDFTAAFRVAGRLPVLTFDP